MSKYRTAYAPEFRQQLVELVHAGRSANDVGGASGNGSQRTLTRFSASENRLSSAVRHSQNSCF